MNDKYVRAFDITQDETPGRFTGYASVFDVVDSWGTVFDRGAFKKTIKDHKGMFPVLRMHDSSEPIGMARVEEDEKGLRVVEGKLDLDVQTARDVYSGMKMGYISQMSHRFHAIREKATEGVTHYSEVRLLEVSAVTMNFASNDEAEIETVRTEIQDELDDVKRRAAAESRIITLPSDLTAGIERLQRALTGTVGAAGTPRIRTSGDHLRTLEQEVARLSRALKGV